MTNEEVLGSLIKVDFCLEKAYWQIKNIPQDDARRVGITDRRLKQLLRRIDNVDSEMIDIITKLKAHDKLTR